MIPKFHILIMLDLTPGHPPFEKKKCECSCVHIHRLWCVCRGKRATSGSPSSPTKWANIVNQSVRLGSKYLYPLNYIGGWLPISNF